MKRIFLSSLLVTIILLLTGWGFLVHRTVAQLAIYELPKPMQAFFFANKDSLVYGAPRPDIRRNAMPDEGSKHFLDLEYFGDNPIENIPRQFSKAINQYSLDTLKKYGTLPYVIEENLQKLTDAFRTQNADSILFYASDLSHYISDAHVPLHTSINYDGQLTGQDGLHDLWETIVPEVGVSNYDLSSRHKATYIADPSQLIWKILAQSHALLPDMLAKEKVVSKNFTEATKYRWEVRWGKNRRFYTTEFARQYSAALGASINDQLIASANHISDFWYTAWVNAGKPDLNSILKRPYYKCVFKTERKAFKKNQLMKKRMLIATQRRNRD